MGCLRILIFTDPNKRPLEAQLHEIHRTKAYFTDATRQKMTLKIVIKSEPVLSK